MAKERIGDYEDCILLIYKIVADLPPESDKYRIKRVLQKAQISCKPEAVAVIDGLTKGGLRPLRKIFRRKYYNHLEKAIREACEIIDN